jgi:hypothetical protein
MVYGEGWEYASLRIVEAATKTITTLPTREYHVYDFSWSPYSKHIAYATKGTHGADSADRHGSCIAVVHLEEQIAVSLAPFPAPLEDFCWVAGDLCWRGAMMRAAYSPRRRFIRCPWMRRHGKDMRLGRRSVHQPGPYHLVYEKCLEEEVVVQVQKGLLISYISCRKGRCCIMNSMRLRALTLQGQNSLRWRYEASEQFYIQLK